MIALRAHIELCLFNDNGSFDVAPFRFFWADSKMCTHDIKHFDLNILRASQCMQHRIRIKYVPLCFAFNWTDDILTPT